MGRSFFKPWAPAPARVFPRRRIGFAVGDIHGRVDLLDRLLPKMEGAALRASETPLFVFAGDYIDRGRDSRAVLDRLASYAPKGVERHFLLGNHEQMMLDFLVEPLDSRRWLLMGGMETIASYGVRPPSPSAPDAELREAAEALAAAMPRAHLDFLQGLERYVEVEGYLFVHAGIDPDKSLAAQKDRDLLWIREPFLSAKRPLSHRVVHGHTPVAAPSASPDRIAIDTGAYATGRLTAAQLQNADVSFITA